MRDKSYVARLAADHRAGKQLKPSDIDWLIRAAFEWEVGDIACYSDSDTTVTLFHVDQVGVDKLVSFYDRDSDGFQCFGMEQCAPATEHEIAVYRNRVPQSVTDTIRELNPVRSV